MEIKRYELFIDESGKFQDDIPEVTGQHDPSLVGGLLCEYGYITDEYVEQLLPEPVHCKDEYKHQYLEVLERLCSEGCIPVVFENRERISLINCDITYLNIISEGLVKLFRDLVIENKGCKIEITVYIATRKAMAASHGILVSSEYHDRLQESIYMNMGRRSVNNCVPVINFVDARTNRRSDLADIVCNTYLTKNGRKKFSDEDRVLIKQLYKRKRIYPVFEDVMTSYLKTLLIERHYGEILFQLCTLPNQSKFETIIQQVIEDIASSDTFEQETWFGQMSLTIGQYNRKRLYHDGIILANNYYQYFIKPFSRDKRLARVIPYWRFDTDFYLLTMYDHVGNMKKCQKHLEACKSNVESINSSWEHIGYYFDFCIREMNALMGKFSFDEVMSRSDELLGIFSEAKKLFGRIKTYNGTTQDIKSELLGKTYGVRVEAMINLLHNHPKLAQQALEESNKAVKEFTKPRDISRQNQWKCLLMITLNKPNEAYEALINSVDNDEGKDPIDLILYNSLDTPKTGSEFVLWHYTNVMNQLIKQGDPRGETMVGKLLSYSQIKDECFLSSRKDHPWQLILWNIACYYRMKNDYSSYKGLYRKAIKITQSNKENVTMMTFALSMSADRLLWCMNNKGTDKVEGAQIELKNLTSEVIKAGASEGMKNSFHMKEIEKIKDMKMETLQCICDAYLK